jgi:hypothetical protein
VGASSPRNAFARIASGSFSARSCGRHSSLDGLGQAEERFHAADDFVLFS